MPAPQPITYTNRKGQTYFLCSATTKHGKTRYIFARAATSTTVAVIPAGFEIAESTNGVVSLRKCTPHLISEVEVELVRAALRKHAHLDGCRVEVRKDAIIVYAPLALMDDLDKMFPWAPASQRAALRRELLKKTPYDPMMRFVLTDVEKRTFHPERMCYTGGENRWWLIGRAARLERVVQFVEHIGRESFFELL